VNVLIVSEKLYRDMYLSHEQVIMLALVAVQKDDFSFNIVKNRFTGTTGTHDPEHMNEVLKCAGLVLEEFL